MTPALSPPLLELRSVSKQYERPDRAPFTALADIDLRVNAGEFVALVGKSGSGKSTLLNLMAGLDRPTTGEVRGVGADLHAMSEDELARWRGQHAGVVFQFFQLLPTLTVLENVVLAMELVGQVAPAARRETAGRLLEQVGIAEQASKLPSALSGGQQQRAAIARALANDPALLVADEPTGNLDSTSADAVLALFEGLVQRGKTVLVVTHDEELARRTERIVRLRDGRIIEDRRTVAS